MRLAQKTVLGCPREDVIYAVFTHFLKAHDKTPHRFTIYPQMNLRWNPMEPGDQRAEVPDFGLGNFTLPGHLPVFKLRCGVEAKRALEIMEKLPEPDSITSNFDLMTTFHRLYLQAQNQAKAAYRNDYHLANDGIWWILLVGPYWKPYKFGPFSEAELGVRALKSSSSDDFEETMKLQQLVNKPPSKLYKLFLLGTAESYEELERILVSTDVLAQRWIEVCFIRVILVSCSN